MISPATKCNNSAKPFLQIIKLLKAGGISSSPDDIAIDEVWID